MAAIGRRQHALLTIAQLQAAGLDTSAVRKRVKRGVLHWVHRGVYSLSPVLSHEARCLAAVLAAGEGAVLSHLAAANLWGVRRSSAISVTAPKRRRIRGVIAHHTTLDPRDVTWRRGIPVTTIARMFVDLSGVLMPLQLANVIHEAAFRKLFDERATRAAMARDGRRLETLERALALNAAGSAGTKSANEDAFVALVTRHGYPEPLVNVHVRGFEVDAHWPQRRLAVEIDGGGHERERTARDDERRDAVLRAHGYKVLRFADVELKVRPEDVLSALGRAW